MARPSIEMPCIDLGDISRKRDLIREVGTLAGMYRVSIEPTRNTRTLQQNRWYWGCIVTPFAKYLSSQDYDVTSPEMAHEVLKARFLASSLVNKDTGEVVQRYVRSTTTLTTAEMADYCERARCWLASFFGLITEDPDPSWSGRAMEVA